MGMVVEKKQIKLMMDRKWPMYQRYVVTQRSICWNGRRSCNRRNEKWNPRAPEFFKINFDASYHQNMVLAAGDVQYFLCPKKNVIL